MDQENLRGLVGRFKDARVLVVGDIYLDENVFGVVTGISLEAPIPIYEVRERRYNPGAAGNAACNAASLGATTYMVGYVGKDANADIVLNELRAGNVDTSGVVVDAARPTNTYGKLRAGGHNILTQEILRTDTPSPAFVAGKTESDIIANIEARARDVDVIVVVDQVSSVVTEQVLRAVVECARKHDLLTVGDSRNRAGAFQGFDVLVPNDREAGLGAGIDVIDDASLNAAGKALLSVCENVLVTCGPAGIRVFAKDGVIEDVPIVIDPRAVVDVTGAGDTVTAAAALTLSAGGSLREAAAISNAAAGVAVTQPGVVTVSNAELEQALGGAGRPAKLKRHNELKAIVERMKKEGKSVVWTNGCFDILHAGHITYLMKAAQVGDVLVVGLNSDASVRAVKGPTRPIVNEIDRARVLSALEFVDYLAIFDDPTTEPLLELLRPDVYVKGGDYTIDTINQAERRLVEGYGGKIVIIPGIEGKSTTAIVERIATRLIDEMTRKGAAQ
ncbi:MAG TPA: D-glycero-beta-D-manno-heptose 1-phosphate adenylyltransferase [Candidatus Hydrogenedentes bacterium]|nr:D-glycero-beta-D-manno-heptose 1-phosphate adenylyltransferase [Candidatus Hydrogenedentota bacterium]